MNFLIICLIALISSFALMCILMPLFIKLLVSHSLNQEVSEYALEEYKQKAKTPIMGGLLFVLLPTIIYLAMNYNLNIDKRVLMMILSYILYAFVGFLDDITIILRKDNEGLSPKVKLIMEFIFVLIIYFLFRNQIDTYVYIPFLKINVELSYFYIPLMIMIYLAEANAVNFTDGMDGLCAGVSVIALLAFVVIAFIQQEFNIILFLLCVIGGLLGYLVYNHYPAKIFMGDSGSLALGGLFSAIGILLNKEIALFIIGGIFVYEMFCVCLQLTWVKLFHKRIFKYTPIHYAFVLKGMKETKVVLLFYILGIILAILGIYIGIN